MRPLPAGLVCITYLGLAPSLRAGDTSIAPLPAGATARLGAGPAAVRALAVAPDGTVVAVARGSSVSLFRLTGAELRTLQGHQRPVLSLAYAPGGEFLASATGPGDPGPLRLWEPVTGELIRRWGDASRTVRDLAFSADGMTLAVLEPDGVTLHDPRRGRFAGALPLPAGTGDFCRLALSPDGRTLVAGCMKPERVVWDLPDRRLLRCCPTPGPCRGLHFLPDGRRLLWLDPDDLRVCTLAADDDTRSFTADCLPNVTAVALAADGRVLALARGSEVTVWDVSTRRTVRRLVGHRATVRALAFTPDGRSLVSGDDAGAALVWAVAR